MDIHHIKDGLIINGCSIVVDTDLMSTHWLSWRFQMQR